MSSDFESAFSKLSLIDPKLKDRDFLLKCRDLSFKIEDILQMISSNHPKTCAVLSKEGCLKQVDSNYDACMKAAIDAENIGVIMILSTRARLQGKEKQEGKKRERAEWIYPRLDKYLEYSKEKSVIHSTLLLVQTSRKPGSLLFDP